MLRRRSGGRFVPGLYDETPQDKPSRWRAWAEFVWRRRDQWILPAWHLALAIVMLMDISQCYSLLYKGWIWAPPEPPKRNRTRVDMEDVQWLVDPLKGVRFLGGRGGGKRNNRRRQQQEQQLLEELDDPDGVCSPYLMEAGEELSEDENMGDWGTCASPATVAMDDLPADSPDNNNNKEEGEGEEEASSFEPPPLLLQLIPSWIDTLCICLCIVEAFRQALDAKTKAYENAALRAFEEQVSRFGSQFRRYSQRWTPVAAQRLQERLDEELAKTSLRMWAAVGFVLWFWFCLIPWRSFLLSLFPFLDLVLSSSTSTSPTDPNDSMMMCVPEDMTIFSLWLSHTTHQLGRILNDTIEYLYKYAWNKAIWHAIRRPWKFYRQFKKFMRWIRFLRFAGPLIRMMDKVQAQLRDLLATYRQSRVAHQNRLSRTRRSLLQQDIRRIASLENARMAVRSAKSQLFRLVPEQYQELLQAEVGDALGKEKQIRKQRQRHVQFLEESLKSSKTNLADVYDQLVDLSERDHDHDHISHRGSIQTQTSASSSASRSSTTSHSSSSKILTSNDHLIPPNTRLSVGWRMVVSVSLILELCRIYGSWRVAGDHTALALHDLLVRIWDPCAASSTDTKTDQPKSGKNPVFRLVRQGVSALLRLRKGGGDNADSRMVADAAAEACRQRHAAAASAWSVQVFTAMEHGIDVVCFIDIFVWFFTGELNERGVVVPKPFFSRCIVPGTLIQVFDHPTLPSKIPSLMLQGLWAAESVGYGRAARWGLVLFPALDVLVWAPLKSYLFRPASNFGGFSAFEERHSFRGSFVY